eukprot:365408-Chlamydomonas_euryale.AAC.3
MRSSRAHVAPSWRLERHAAAWSTYGRTIGKHLSRGRLEVRHSATKGGAHGRSPTTNCCLTN